MSATQREETPEIVDKCYAASSFSEQKAKRCMACNPARYLPERQHLQCARLG